MSVDNAGDVIQFDDASDVHSRKINCSTPRKMGKKGLEIPKSGHILEKSHLKCWNQLEKMTRQWLSYFNFRSWAKKAPFWSGLSLAWEFLFWMLSFHGIYLTPSNAKSPVLVFICLFIQTAGKRYCFSAQKAGKAYTWSLKKLENCFEN